MAKTRTIGVVIDDLCNKYFFDFINGLQDMSEQLDYNIIFCNSRDNNDIKFRYVNYLLDVTDGIISYGGRFADGKTFKRLMEKGLPFVLVEANIPDYEFNNMQIDNKSAGYRATKHLLDLGYKKIWHITGDLNYNASIDRRNGFLRAMQDYNVPLDENGVV